MAGRVPLLLAGRVKVKESEGKTDGRKRRRVQDLSSDEEVPGNHSPFHFYFIIVHVLPDPSICILYM